MRLHWEEAFWGELYLVSAFNYFNFKAQFENMVTVIKKKSNKKNLTKKFKKALTLKGVDTRKYCGVIKLKGDPLAIQKELRDEWG